MPRRILQWTTFDSNSDFKEWQIANPLCDVMRISPIGDGQKVFVVWRAYV